MKTNILLDLDNTLVFSYTVHKPVYDYFKTHRFNRDIYILERPFLQQFLDELMKYFSVSIWTAARVEYAEFIVKNIILGGRPNRKVHYVFHRDHVEDAQNIFGNLKDLRLLSNVYKIPLFKNPTIIIDDLREVCYHQQKSCIQIKSFEGENPNDQELLTIISILLG